MPQQVTLETKDYAKYYVQESFSAREWKCFNKIVYRESRWIDTAENGDYYGLGQLYRVKNRHKGKPRLQVRAALRYMVNRYETPCHAYQFHIENGWY